MLGKNRQSIQEQPVRRRLSDSNIVKPQTYSRARTISDVAKWKRFRSDRDEELKKERRSRRSYMFFISCLVVAIISVLVLTQVYFDATYVSFNEDTDNVVKQPDFDKMLSLTREYLYRHPFERISFLLNRNNFEQYIIAGMPEIKDAKLQKANLFTNSLSVSLRHPLASFKGQYVDSEGVVFKDNFFSPPDLEIIDNSGAGSNSLSGNFLGFIGQTISELNIDGMTTQKVVIPPRALRYVDLYLSGVSYPFKAQIDRNPANQVLDIINMKKYLDEKNITPSYVDVRVEGKGYWR